MFDLSNLFLGGTCGERSVIELKRCSTQNSALTSYYLGANSLREPFSKWSTLGLVFGRHHLSSKSLSMDWGRIKLDKVHNPQVPEPPTWLEGPFSFLPPFRCKSKVRIIESIEVQVRGFITRREQFSISTHEKSCWPRFAPLRYTSTGPNKNSSSTGVLRQAWLLIGPRSISQQRTKGQQRTK